MFIANKFDNLQPPPDPPLLDTSKECYLEVFFKTQIFELF